MEKPFIALVAVFVIITSVLLIPAADNTLENGVYLAEKQLSVVYLTNREGLGRAQIKPGSMKPFRALWYHNDGIWKPFINGKFADDEYRIENRQMVLIPVEITATPEGWLEDTNEISPY